MPNGMIICNPDVGSDDEAIVTVDLPHVDELEADREMVFTVSPGDIKEREDGLLVLQPSASFKSIIRHDHPLYLHLVPWEGVQIWITKGFYERLRNRWLM